MINMPMNKKNIFLWTLYDFANSIAIIVFFVYFSQWLVIDQNVADIWYNLIFVGSTILLILTGPVISSISDKLNSRMPFLAWFTVLVFITFLGVSFSALLLPKPALAAGIFFLLSNYFYQLSFSFYNPLLSQIAVPSKQGFISGLGQAGNWLGQIAGLLITLPLAAGAVFFLGSPGRAQTFLPATLLFFLLSLPMLVLFKEAGTKNEVKIDIAGEFKNYIKDFLGLWNRPGMGAFLLAYFFFNDAVTTASANFPIFLEQVFAVSDDVKSYLMVGILATSAVGALVSGYLGDRFGLKKTLVWILVGWAVVFPLLAVITDFNLFVSISILMGFLFGSVWAVSRAIMVYLSPPDKLNYAFSYYTMAERFSSFLGPVVWGLTATLLAHLGPTRYRMAALSMTIFIFLGLFIIKKVPAKI